jgi:CDP-paratose 2-epimerase
LERELRRFRHHELDIRDRSGIGNLVHATKPTAIVHAAAQPSHDLAARIPFDDFDTNAGGTLNLLEAVRRSVPEAPFVFMSTNKVYGDRPNTLPLVDLGTRFDYREAEDYNGIGESFPIDGSTHSLFGASKLAADIMVQEYGRYFGMRTVCLRGGCLTGPQHAGVELHGFLNFLVKCNVERRRYRVFGYLGKQVRDNIHARDVAMFIERFVAEPSVGEVYNIGGGRTNSCSILEAFEMIGAISGDAMEYEYVEEPRKGDHLCYISDLSKAKSDYPGWSPQTTLMEILRETYEMWKARV